MEHLLAHISQDGREQTVLAHLEGTALLSCAFATELDAAEQGKLAGLAHDIGKYTGAFQRRLLDGGPKVDHATAGAFECLRSGQPFAAFAVAGHHGGLPDGGSRGDAPETGTFWGRINRATQGKLDDYSAWTQELSLPVAVQGCWALCPFTGCTRRSPVPRESRRLIWLGSRSYPDCSRN